MKFYFILLVVLSFSTFSSKRKGKVIYKYKKYQKFDFENFVVDGDVGSPGDISLSVREKFKYNNKLPLKKNFNFEIRRSLERVR